jgi:endonuclease I
MRLVPPRVVGQRCQPRVRYPYTSTHTDVWDIVKEADRALDDRTRVTLLYARGAIVPGGAGAEHARGWSREHCWPQSLGGMRTDRPGMGTDAHNLFCADASMNSARSNKAFAEGGAAVIDRTPLEGARDSDGRTDCRATATTWEPPDEAKGVVARALLYMACAYAQEGLRLSERPPSAKGRTMGRLSTILAWNARFPPDAWERRRATVVARYQGNPNPFVEDPTLADRVDWTLRCCEGARPSPSRTDCRSHDDECCSASSPPVPARVPPPLPGVMATCVEEEECRRDSLSYARPRITEIHYDNRGRDVNEGVEVEVPRALARSPAWMRRLCLLMYNGADGRVYSMVFGDALEVGTAYEEDGIHLFYWHGRLQNGRGDALALVTEGDDNDGAEPTLVHEFLSWEGTCRAVEGPCEGRQSTDIGVRESGRTAEGASLQRTGHARWRVAPRANFGVRNRQHGDR